MNAPNSTQQQAAGMVHSFATFRLQLGNWKPNWEQNITGPTAVGRPDMTSVSGHVTSDDVVVVVARGEPVLPLQGAVAALSAMGGRLGLGEWRGRPRRRRNGGGRQ